MSYLANETARKNDKAQLYFIFKQVKSYKLISDLTISKQY